MSELAYDPEYPYVVNAGFGYPGAKFHLREYAEEYAEQIGSIVKDTTPKPKIPADAHHITWGIGELAYSLYVDDLWYGWNHGAGLSDEQLLEMIGDAEVIVLVRKEDA